MCCVVLLLCYVIQNKAYSGMRVHVSVGIKYREDIPIVTFSQSFDVRVCAGQQLMQNIHDSRRRNPLPGVITTFEKDSGIVIFKGNLDAFDLTSLIGSASHNDFYFGGILFGQIIQVFIDFPKSVVAFKIK